MIDVQMEREELDAGTPMMYRDFGSRIRIAFDPNQVTEERALVILCMRIPRLAHHMKLHRRYA